MHDRTGAVGDEIELLGRHALAVEFGEIAEHAAAEPDARERRAAPPHRHPRAAGNPAICCPAASTAGRPTERPRWLSSASPASRTSAASSASSDVEIALAGHGAFERRLRPDMRRRSSAKAAQLGSAVTGRRDRSATAAPAAPSSFSRSRSCERRRHIARIDDDADLRQRRPGLAEFDGTGSAGFRCEAGAAALSPVKRSVTVCV